MTERISGPQRRQFRLGPVGLVVDADASFEVAAPWLPHTNISNDDAPAVAISVHRNLRPVEPAGAPSLELGRVRAWVTPDGERVTLLTPTGSAQLDLRGRLARVDVGTDRATAAQLLDLATSLLLARVSTCIANASAVVDRTGWAWLLLGEACARNKFLRDCCADGGRYVSDSQALVRVAPMKPDLMVVESWHRPHARHDGSSNGSAPVLSWERWRPLAALRGVLLVTPVDGGDAAAHAARAGGWRRAEPAEVTAALDAALPLRGLDPIGDERVARIVEACGARLAFHAPVTAAEAPSLRALSALQATVDEYVI